MTQQIERHDPVALGMSGDIQAEGFQMPADAVQKDHGFGPVPRFDQARRQPPYIDPAVRKGHAIHRIPIAQVDVSLVSHLRTNILVFRFLKQPKSFEIKRSRAFGPPKVVLTLFQEAEIVGETGGGTCPELRGRDAGRDFAQREFPLP